MILITCTDYELKRDAVQDADVVLRVDAGTQTFTIWKHRFFPVWSYKTPLPVFSVEKHLPLFIEHDSMRGNLSRRHEIMREILDAAEENLREQQD